MKRLITNILFLLTAALAMGQNSLKVQAPEIVALDERFNVTFVISARRAQQFRLGAGGRIPAGVGPAEGKLPPAYDNQR